MPLLIRIIMIVIGYAFGLIQTGFFYGKITGNDLRKEGSGNTGATNALRTHGIKAALIIFFFDALKAFIPCFAVRMFFKDDAYCFVYLLYTALGVILGNDYPVYLRFQPVQLSADAGIKLGVVILHDYAADKAGVGLGGEDHGLAALLLQPGPELVRQGLAHGL